MAVPCNVPNYISIGDTKIFPCYKDGKLLIYVVGNIYEVDGNIDGNVCGDVRGNVDGCVGGDVRGNVDGCVGGDVRGSGEG